MIDKYGKQPLKHQPVFIIGAPRTGSTILYQVITNIFDVLYIDNLTCIFEKNIFYGFWLSKKLTKHKAHNNFKSYHGNTINYGLRAPSECGGYWYRWLPKDHHFIDYDEINGKIIEEIKQEITVIINYFDKPIVFKNLNAGQRLRLLTQCFPDAKFIFIKRTPLFTAQSIYKSRLKLNIPQNQVWGILPKNFKTLEKLDIFQLITRQIYLLEKQVRIDQELVKTGNFLTLNYEELEELRCTR
ncbi:MAG: sulfotransferase [Candidatus Marinimicrobia bacterium]|nr:sulfotransferase [Candidatus Neomarinimicrobiota bacterium]